MILCAKKFINRPWRELVETNIKTLLSLVVQLLDLVLHGFSLTDQQPTTQTTQWHSNNNNWVSFPKHPWRPSQTAEIAAVVLTEEFHVAASASVLDTLSTRTGNLITTCYQSISPLVVSRFFTETKYECSMVL